MARCLEALFPSHSFETVSAREEPDGTRIPFDSFTSSRLPPRLVPDALRRLVEKLASEVYPGRDGNPADMAVLIEDLELPNADQIPVLVEAVRGAVSAHLADVQERRGSLSRDRAARALRERASFHLAVPMIESWLFGDATALATVGVPEERMPPRLVSGRDPERFETSDPDFSMDDGSACAALAARNARRHEARRPAWVLVPRPTVPLWRRELHPKAYLSWLCRDPANERCSTYREAEGGADALASLSWPVVLGAPDHFQWARALVHDLADALNEPVPAFAEGSCARMPLGGSPILRNL